MAPDSEFLCLFLTRAKQKEDRGEHFGTEKRRGFSRNTNTNIIIISYLCSHIYVCNDTQFIIAHA